MEFAIHPLDLDLLNRQAEESVYVKRGDSHRMLRIKLWQGQERYPLSPDLSAVFTAKTENGTAIFNPLTGEYYADDKFGIIKEN